MKHKLSFELLSIRNIVWGLAIRVGRLCFCWKLRPSCLLQLRACFEQTYEFCRAKRSWFSARPGAASYLFHQILQYLHYRDWHVAEIHISHSSIDSPRERERVKERDGERESEWVLPGSFKSHIQIVLIFITPIEYIRIWPLINSYAWYLKWTVLQKVDWYLCFGKH